MRGIWPRTLEPVVVAVPLQCLLTPSHRRADTDVSGSRSRQHAILGDGGKVATAWHGEERQWGTDGEPASSDGGATSLALVSRQVLDRAQEAFVSIAADGVVEVWNAAAESMFGWSEEEAVGHELATLIVPEHLREAHRNGLARFAGTGQGQVTGRCLSVPAVRRDGSELPVEMTLVPVSVGERVIFQAFVHDISNLSVVELAVADRALREAHDRFAKAFRNAPIGMALVALTGRLIAVNAALCALLGRVESQLLATDFRALTHPDDLQADLDLLERLVSGAVLSYQLEKRYLRPDGSAVWTLLSVSLVRDADEQPLHFVSQIQDITVAKQAEDELRRYTEHLHALSRQDTLTELPNRRELLSALDGELQRAGRHGGAFSLVLLDLEQFTTYNNAHGDGAGDEVLRTVADTLRACCRGSDTAARIGGDDFALLLPETGNAGAQVTASRVRAAIEQLDPPVRIAFGISSFPEAGTSRELMMVRAEMALYAGRTGTQADAVDGLDKDDRTVRRVLELARSQLQMKVVYLTEHTDADQQFRQVVGDSASFGINAGGALPLTQTYCQHMLAGTIPNVVGDIRAAPLSAGPAATRDAEVRAYVGVPVRLSDGQLYGTLCAVDGAAHPQLGERDAALMHFLAATLADRIEHHERQSTERRAQAEISGIHALLAAVAARDHYTSEHSHHVVELAAAVAVRLGLDRQQIADVQQMAVLHDVGKVGIPDAVLQKRGPLTAEEWELMRQHPAIGARMLEATSSLARLAPAVRAEHERWDGTGYPDGLHGGEIPVASRITLACDAYHAMTSDRPYRAALSSARACAELTAHAGTQFDPNVVDVLLNVLNGELHPLAMRRHGGIEESSVLQGHRHPSGPSWTPLSEPGQGSAMAQVRCACQSCGAHLPGTLSQANLLGSCPNCGSYEIALVKS